MHKGEQEEGLNRLDGYDQPYINADMDMDMDVPSEAQVEATQAETTQAEATQAKLEAQAETLAQDNFDEANLAVQEHRKSAETVDISKEVLTTVEQQLSDSINYRSITGSGAFERKTMGNTDQSKCRENVKDIVIFGDDLFKLMAKASSEAEGWMKSTKGMDTGKGCVIQVTTQQRNQDGSYSIAEALTYVQGVTLVEQYDEDGKVIGRRLKGVR